MAEPEALAAGGTRGPPGPGGAGGPEGRGPWCRLALGKVPAGSSLSCPRVAAPEALGTLTTHCGSLGRVCKGQGPVGTRTAGVEEAGEGEGAA